MPRLTFAALLFALLALSPGCAEHINPSFPLTTSQARDAIEQMRQSPKPLRRPVVLIGGLFDPDLSTSFYKDFFQGISKNATFITVAPGFCETFDDSRRLVLSAVNAACPTSDPNFTVEVDVVGASLGGVVARYAAAPSHDPAHPQRLRIAHLYTISSPHTGAILAETIALNNLQHDLKPGSPFLTSLAAQYAAAKYQLIPYVHLNDEIVGQQNAAPAGQLPYWLDNDSIFSPHAAAMMDERILADIARRLRDEPPFTIPPPAPFPSETHPPSTSH